MWSLAVIKTHLCQMQCCLWVIIWQVFLNNSSASFMLLCWGNTVFFILIRWCLLHKIHTYALWCTCRKNKKGTFFSFLHQNVTLMLNLESLSLKGFCVVTPREQVCFIHHLKPVDLTIKTVAVVLTPACFFFSSVHLRRGWSNPRNLWAAREQQSM